MPRLRFFVGVWLERVYNSSHGLGKFPQDVGHEGIFLDFALGRPHVLRNVLFEILNLATKPRMQPSNAPVSLMKRGPSSVRTLWSWWSRTSRKSLNPSRSRNMRRYSSRVCNPQD